jgi:DNA-binding response OmpR family regulator
MSELTDYIRDFNLAVLLVEDDEITKKIETYTLQELGCKVDAVPTATAAKTALSKVYDLIVLDVGLPDQNGVKLAEEIRSGRTKQKFSTPIVVVSARAEETDRQRYAMAGIDDVFAKPMNPEIIKKLLLSIIDKKDIH